MPRYFDIRNIAHTFEIPFKDAKKIVRDYEDVLPPSPFSVGRIKYYSYEIAELVSKIYQRSKKIKDSHKLREVLGLPEKKEEKKEEKRVEKPSKPRPKNKGVESILFELFKARLEEYLQNGLVTKSQFNELLEYEKGKL